MHARVTALPVPTRSDAMCFNRPVTDMPSRDHAIEPELVPDDVDRAIIRELQEDGRRTYGRIAAAVGLTEAPTRQRVWRLTESGVIEIVAIVNPSALGLTLRAVVGLQCSGDFTQLAAALSAIDEIDWLVATAGGFDLLAEIRCRDEQHLYAVIAKQICSRPEVNAVESFVYLNLFKATYSWPPGSGWRIHDLPTPAAGRGRPQPDASGAASLDDLDWAIIRELRTDGRQTYGRIAETLNVSLRTVRQRVPRLIEADVIRIAAIVNPRVQGFRMRATLGIHCAGDPDDVASTLTDIDEIESLYAVTGRFDLLGEVQCRDQQHLFRVLAEQVRTVPGVRGTEVFVFLNILKIRYPWPRARLP
jgi:DNA-binding Lrp family transcriptional regulator